MTYTLAYNNYNMICENCIGTWSGERMKQTYTLLDYYGKPWTGNGAGTYTNYSVNQPYGIFSNDSLSGDKNSRSRLLGSIAYVRRNDRFQGSHAVLITRLDSFTVSDTVAYVEPGYHTSKYRFGLLNLQSSVGVNLIAKNLTGIGGKGSIYGTEWKKSSLSEGGILGSVANVFTSTAGAKLCYRYKDGLLTTQPLWPWPMNQRIINGLLESGRSAVDVTATVQTMLGTIPSSCKGTATNLVSSVAPAQTSNQAAATLPSAPADLQVRP
jgi:hypothetical protein